MATILDQLNALDPGDDTGHLAWGCTYRTFCPGCGHVDESSEDLRNHPCQTCKVNCETRQNLFGSDEQDLLRIIFDSYRGKNPQLCVLLFCSLMEQHFRKLLIQRCIRLDIQDKVIDALIDGFLRFDKRVSLFNDLTDLPPDAIFAEKEVKDLFSGYRQLRKKRNKLAHGADGATYLVDKDDIRLAVTLATDSFSAFAFLHHKYCSMDSPPLPTK